MIKPVERGAALEEGKTYRNHRGGTFICLSGGTTPTLQNVASDWVFAAHVITLYENGSIEWGYSTGGHFEKTDRRWP